MFSHRPHRGRLFLPAILLVLNFAAVPPSVASVKTDSGWENLPALLSRIKEPVIPAKEFSVTDFGAVPNSANDSGEAFSKALEACSKAGGGHVVVPAGDYLIGPIRLGDNTDLHLDKGATLKFTTDSKRYLPAVPTRFEGMDCINYAPMILAEGATNVSITGQGTIDGQADDSNWLGWKGRKGPQPGTQTEARSRLGKMNEESVPPGQRLFGEGDFLRPDFLAFYHCSNVLIEGVHLRRPPMWTIHPLLCTNVILRGLDIETHGANNDGCDPESCRDLLIEKCTFTTGDDCIAIKSGRNNDGRRVNVPSEGIVVRDSTMHDGHGGVTIGSEISGGCRGVYVDHCVMDSPSLACVLRIKSNAARGGVVRDVFVRNVSVGTVKDSVLQIDMLYGKEKGSGDDPRVSNVSLSGITVANTPRILNVRGYPGASISDVRITDSTFRGLVKPDVLVDASVDIKDCTLDRVK
jgi:polygalacturonase